ncbi:substrate-binding periplasmic protein [Craterilacuibacter sp.]|uniref:substrate-binding periplasmic protein n=1 Tax=Craterilacuibacter sp. TaxID=2870909 RepID=UPI003F67E3BF
MGKLLGGGEARPLRVGINAAYAPFESLDASGQPVGFDIALMRELGRRIGREVEFVNLPWRRLLQSLAQRRLDVVISAVAITPARRRNFRFTQAYYSERQGLLRAEALSAQPIQQLMRIGVLENSRAEDHLQRLGVVPGRVFEYADADAMLQAYLAAKVDALFGDEHVLRELRHATTGVLSFDAAFGLDEYAIVLPLDEAGLQALLDRALQSMHDDGSLAVLTRQLEE